MPLAALEFALSVSWTAAWFWATLLIGLVWLRRHLDLNAAAHEPILSERDAVGPEPLPTLTVLVAAKDEESNIGACVAGLLAQDYPGLEIVAVDDRSSDRTGAILDSLAARNGRIRVIHVRELPAGWAGKNHAMHLGVQAAGGELLCFTDADCRFHSPLLLQAAVRFARRAGVDFLSVLPHLDAFTFWERVVQPPAGAIMVFWFPPDKVNDPRSPRAYANGAFMLLSRAAYAACGGHERFKTTLNEDMHFARAAKQAGLRLRVIRGGRLYSCRMYVGFRQIWRGWSRIFYGCFGSVPRLLVSVVFLTVFSLSPYLTLVLAAISPAPGGLAAAAMLAIAAQQSVLWRFYRLSHVAPIWALTWPVGAALCLGMTCNALTRHWGARTTWRGTTYTGGA